MTEKTTYKPRMTVGRLIDWLGQHNRELQILLSTVDGENYSTEAYLRETDTALDSIVLYASYDDDAAERRDKQTELVASAKAKLSPEELRALGIKL